MASEPSSFLRIGNCATSPQGFTFCAGRREAKLLRLTIAARRPKKRWKREFTGCPGAGCQMLFFSLGKWRGHHKARPELGLLFWGCWEQHPSWLDAVSGDRGTPRGWINLPRCPIAPSSPWPPLFPLPHGTFGCCSRVRVPKGSWRLGAGWAGAVKNSAQVPSAPEAISRWVNRKSILRPIHEPWLTAAPLAACFVPL